MTKNTIVRMSACAWVFALLACVTAQAGAQGSEAAGASAAPAASSAREVRKANRALSRKVYAALAKHKEIDAGNISVVSRNGAVTLNGTVTDASQIDVVATIAQGVPGVTSVSNKLTVQRPFGQ